MSPQLPGPPVVAVVMPFGPIGAHMAIDIRRHNGRAVAVTLPDALLPPHYRGAHGRIDRDLYDDVIYDTAPDTTVAALRTWGVTAVLASTEIAVERTEVLAAALGLPGNAPATTRLRRDKGAMAEALPGCGVSVPRSLVTGRLQDALEWAEWLGGDVIVKPLDSAGSQGVTRCSNTAELTAAWGRLCGLPHAMGGVAHELIVQEPLPPGLQYIANAVTLPGPNGWPVHTVTEVWRDIRAGDEESTLSGAWPWHVYDRADLLRPDDPFALEVRKWVGRVLDGLDVRYGPTHTELKATSTGLVAIESGARLMGAYHPDAVQMATGSDHVRDTVTAALTGRIPVRDHDPLCVSMVSLASPINGHLDGRLLDVLLNLPTVAEWVGDLTTGAPVTRTGDGLVVPGRLMLVDVSPDAIDHTHQTIREIEASGLYRPLAKTNSCTR